MTKEETKAAIAVMQGWMDGKRVQYRRKEHVVWNNCDNPDWSLDVCDYRIAPEPKVRPWKVEEVPDVSGGAGEGVEEMTCPNDEYHCRECGNVTEEPPWAKARRLGFDAAIHCPIIANRKGIVVRRVYKCSGLCEWCDMGGKYFKDKVIRTAKA